MNIKHSFRRGFTLIELMIVIVILGVLMGTILPRLTGAQARARDTGRVADLNTISQALETYFDDNGIYPAPAAGNHDCLDSSSAVGAAIASYLKGGEIPRPPSKDEAPALDATLKCAGADAGKYLYVVLKNYGIAQNGYALVSDVETYQNANLLTGNTNITFTDLTSQEFGSGINKDSAGADLDNAKKLTAEDTDGQGAPTTVYMVVK